MGKPTKEERIKELRKQATETIKEAQDRQEDLWDSLEIAVHGARAEVDGREKQLIWAKIEELGSANAFPLWMDAILTIFTTAIPVGAIVGRIGAKLALSRKLPALTKVELPAPRHVREREARVQKAVGTISLVEPAPMKSAMERWRGNSKVLENWKAQEELRKQWHEVAKVYFPELENNLRSTVTIAAKAAMQPLYDKDDVQGAKKTRKAASKESTGLPAVTVFVGLLTWIKISRGSDKRILEMLKERVATSEDEDWLKGVPEFIEEGSGISRTPGALERGPDEVFMRFVEACLWCTTFDFTPTITPARTAPHPDLPGVDIELPPKVEVLPFPKAIWDNLVSRHYDPFYKGGDKTYKEAGSSSWIAPESVFSTPFTEASSVFETGMAFDPRMRLSLHWSAILAPALLDTNKELTSAISTYLGQ